MVERQATLFSAPAPDAAAPPPWPDGFRVLPGYLDRPAQEALLADVRAVVAAAPLYRNHMPRSGTPMRIENTNCGPLGWVSDKDRGYRYQATHPVTGAPWPPMPQFLLRLWNEVADYPALPEACLVNLYRGAKAGLGMHIDADEDAKDAPVVSVSLGDTGVFRLGGPTRKGPTRKIELVSGTVVVLGGASRRCHHGVDKVLAGTSDLLDGGGRLNLTLRRVTAPD